MKNWIMMTLLNTISTLKFKESSIYNEFPFSVPREKYQYSFCKVEKDEIFSKFINVCKPLPYRIVMSLTLLLRNKTRFFLCFRVT